MRRGQQQQGEWAAVGRQDIFFVPPKLAATMPQLVKGRRSVEQSEAVKQARGTTHCAVHSAAHCSTHCAVHHLER